MNNDITDQKNMIALSLGLAIGGLLGWQRMRANRIRYPLPTLNGKAATALITGASSGIGAVFARRLAALGYDLVLVARRGKRLTALATELQQQYGIRAEVLVADLAESPGIVRVEKHIEELDTLTLLINNAGFGALKQFVEANVNLHIDMIQVNVVAGVRLSRAALPGMIARGRGAIINVSSVAAFVSGVGNVTYKATKNYLNIFSESLQAEIQDTGVRIQALCPGFTYTEFHDTQELEDFERSQVPKPLWMSAEAVVEESLDALRRDRVIVIPGFINRTGIMVAGTPIGRIGLAILKRLS